MKKTVRINISGVIFNIDEDAYEKLKQYLNSINRQFIDTNEGNEIITDVESRIAELFQERNSDRKEVINLSDIEYVIEIMGKPEDFEESVDEEESAYSEVQPKKATRRIYRDPDNKVLSGLSAGLASYYGLDPIIIRVIFVLMTLFYGTSVLVYIILWIAIPEAKTRSQKLEMKGQDINLSNIESSIRKEFKQVKTNFNTWQDSKNYEKLRTNTGEALTAFWKMFGIIFKICLIFLGIVFLITGICFLGAMTGLYFFDNTFLSPLSWNDTPFSIKEFILLFTDNYNAHVLMISSYLLFLIPVISIIYFGIKFIFKFKSRNKYIGVYAGALWLVSLIVLIVSSVKIAYSMRSSEEMAQTYAIEKKTTDTIYIELFKNEVVDGWDYHHARFNNVILTLNDEDQKLYGEPTFSIEKSSNNLTEFSIVKHSNGINGQDAIKNAKNIDYEWQQDDSVIYLRRYFQLKGEKKIRNQRLYATLKIPVGKVVYIGKNIDQLCSYFENLEDYSCDEMAGHYWIMTEEGLKIYGEPNLETFDKEKAGKDEESIHDTIKSEVKKEIEDMKAELDSMK